MSPYCRCLNHKIPGPHEMDCPLYGAADRQAGHSRLYAEDERGTPSYILARLGDWTQELGQSPYDAIHPLTWLRGYVTDLQRQVREEKSSVAIVKFAFGPHRCAKCQRIFWLQNYSHHGYLIEGGVGEYLTLRYCQRCWP